MLGAILPPSDSSPTTELRDGDDMTAVAVMTWNLQGSKGVDHGAVADAVLSQQVDVIMLQEVQRRQAHTLAARLGWSVEWARKHSPLFVPAEGLAVLVRGQIDEAAVVELHGGPKRSWKRRIAQVVRVSVDNAPLVVVNAHLSPGDDAEQRLAEVETLLRFLSTGSWRDAEPPIFAGDFNTTLPSTALERLTNGGWQDAWLVASSPSRGESGATNWTPGPRGGRPPTQRLDFLLVPKSYRVVETWVPTSYEGWAALSDHLPVRATIERLADG